MSLLTVGKKGPIIDLYPVLEQCGNKIGPLPWEARSYDPSIIKASLIYTYRVPAKVSSYIHFCYRYGLFSHMFIAVRKG